MHIKHRWMRALIGLATLPWTLPALAQDGLQNGLQTLPDQDLLAVHGAGLDDMALKRLGADQDRRRKNDETKGTEAGSTAASQGQLLVNTLSRQAIQMETTLALNGTASAVRMAQTGAVLATITPAVMVAAPLAMPLFGMPMLPR